MALVSIEIRPQISQVGTKIPRIPGRYRVVDEFEFAAFSRAAGRRDSARSRAEWTGATGLLAPVQVSGGQARGRYRSRQAPDSNINAVMATPRELTNMWG